MKLDSGMQQIKGRWALIYVSRRFSETPRYVGRAIASLTLDPDRHRWNQSHSAQGTGKGVWLHRPGWHQPEHLAADQGYLTYRIDLTEHRRLRRNQCSMSHHASSTVMPFLARMQRLLWMILFVLQNLADVTSRTLFSRNDTRQPGL